MKKRPKVTTQYVARALVSRDDNGVLTFWKEGDIVDLAHRADQPDYIQRLLDMGVVEEIPVTEGEPDAIDVAAAPVSKAEDK